MRHEEMTQGERKRETGRDGEGYGESIGERVLLAGEGEIRREEEREEGKKEGANEKYREVGREKARAGDGYGEKRASRHPLVRNRGWRGVVWPRRRRLRALVQPQPTLIKGP